VTLCDLYKAFTVRVFVWDRTKCFRGRKVFGDWDLKVYQVSDSSDSQKCSAVMLSVMSGPKTYASA